VAREQWREIFEYATRDEEHSHILLALPAAALLVYVRRLRLRHFRVEGPWLGSLVLLSGLVMREQGLESNRQVLQHAGAVAIALGCVTSVLGKQALLRFVPSVLVLGFLVPVPGVLKQEVAVTLQNWTAHIAQVLLGVMGVETQVSGNTLSINGRVVQVAEACNGMRLVFLMVLITFVFALSLPLLNWVRVLLLAASPLVALVCNVVRTLPTVWLFGRYGGTEHEWVFDLFHKYSGWAMCLLAFLVLLVVVRVLRWAQLPVQRYTLASQ
jgi:exosortase